jgi:hypothetical protein
LRGGEDDVPLKIISQEKAESQNKFGLKGIFLVREPGLYCIEFDNTASWFTAKSLSFSIRVVEPKASSWNLLPHDVAAQIHHQTNKSTSILTIPALAGLAAPPITKPRDVAEKKEQPTVQRVQNVQAPQTRVTEAPVKEPIVLNVPVPRKKSDFNAEEIKEVNHVLKHSTERTETMLDYLRADVKESDLVHGVIYLSGQCITVGVKTKDKCKEIEIHYVIEGMEWDKVNEKIMNLFNQVCSVSSANLRIRLIICYHDAVVKALMKAKNDKPTSYNSYLEEKFAFLTKLQKNIDRLMIVSNMAIITDVLKERLGSLADFDNVYLINLAKEPQLDIKIAPFDVTDSSLFHKLSLEMMLIGYNRSGESAMKDVRSAFLEEKDMQQKLYVIGCHIWNLHIVSGCTRSKYVINCEDPALLTEEHLKLVKTIVYEELTQSFRERYELDKDDLSKIHENIHIVLEHVICQDYCKVDV